MSPGGPSAAQVDGALVTVFARPELRERGLPAWQEALGKFLAPVVEFIAELLSAIAPAPTDGRYLAWIVGGALALVALVVLAWWVRLTLLGLHREPDARRASRSRRVTAGGDRPAPEAWESAARELAAAGRLREAALALYQALLLRLEAAGSVRYDPAKTPGDYRREARRHRDGYRALDEFLRGFEPVAFGRMPIDRSGYERLSRLAGGVSGGA